MVDDLFWTAFITGQERKKELRSHRTKIKWPQTKPRWNKTGKTAGRKLLPSATSMENNYQHYRLRNMGPQKKGFHLKKFGKELEGPTLPDKLKILSLFVDIKEAGK